MTAANLDKPYWPWKVEKMSDTSVRERLFREAKRQLPNEIDAAIECALDAILVELADPTDGTSLILANYVNGLRGEMSLESAAEALHDVANHIQSGGA